MMSIRAVSLHQFLPRLGLDALLFNTSEVTPSANLRYLTGFTGSDASILLTRTERHFFTDGRYQVQAREEVDVFHVHVVRNKLASLSAVIRASGARRIGIEPSRVSYEFATHLTRRIADAQLVPLKRPFLENFRVRKSPEERQKIEAAAVTASEACREVLDAGLIGRRERDVAADLEFRSLQKGAYG
ncbi:MAG: aminopeptidase P family N-terminal domain-containing protein, partial [Deltaproteobacteria bacterium]|nr:aminopeptidase P family N-terminal domain-containing protein [Deltaproteobacteria bacterium]